MNSKEDQAVFKAQINDAKQVKATPTKDGDQSEQKVNNSEQSSPFDDYYPTVEEVSENFNRVQEAIVEYEDGNVKLPYTDAVRILKRLEQSVMYHSMFSPNEDVSEVATEHLKYMLIPYYMADVFGRITQNRRRNLQFSKIYYDEFIKLVNHYEVLTKEQRKKWKEVVDNAEYEPTREEKIGLFKDKKAMETKIKELEKTTDEDNQRQTLLLIVKTKIIKTFEDIRMINLEFQMQDHREKLEREKKENPNKKEDNKPLPQMKVWQVDKTPQNQPGQGMPNMVSGAKKVGLCHEHMGELRQQMQSEVFQMAGSQPDMTLDEFADMEIKAAQEMEANAKRAAEEAAKEKNNSSDEEVDYKKKREARGWDDWKDNNEKGAGNKMGR